MIQSLIRFVTGFLILFLLYHSAEYMIVFKNNAAGFFLFQALFFSAAWLIAKWQTAQGLSAWGLEWKRSMIKHLLLGAAVGVILYGMAYLLSILNGSEKFISAPSLSKALPQFLLFAFGVFFSSLSEDVLTRGYLWNHLKGRMSNFMLALVSALVYVLNHIYRLADGPETWLYLFALGVLFIIPLIVTNRLWFTGGMHWAGNTVFFVTHSVITTESVQDSLSANYFLVIAVALTVPLVLIVVRIFKLKAAPVIDRIGNYF